MKSRTLLSTVCTKRSKGIDFVREISKTLLGRLGLAAMMILIFVPATGQGQLVPNSKNNPLCQKLGSQIQGSSGMQMYCFGAQANGAASPAARLGPGLTSAAASPQKNGGKGGFIPNVNAASTAEDISPSGVRAFGQSETSIAASGPYVVEAWNDSTGFFAPCGSPNNKEELTGFAFSNNGGSTFTDLGGLPNLNCATSRTEGDPSVEVYQSGGNTYFYIGSIFVPFNVIQNAISVTACQVIGTGSAATLSCGQPIIAGISSDCSLGYACGFLDKDFLSIDAATGKLYVSYTEFGFTTRIALVRSNLRCAILQSTRQTRPAPTVPASVSPILPRFRRTWSFRPTTLISVNRREPIQQWIPQAETFTWPSSITGLPTSTAAAHAQSHPRGRCWSTFLKAA
jgi:hypothetical protein